MPLRDIRVRKALNYAVNRKELLRYAFKGNAFEMRGHLTEKSGVDLSSVERYQWSIPTARKLLEEAGYEDGFRMKVVCHEKDYVLALFLQRFFSLIDIEVVITSAQFEWLVEHIAYPNIRADYSWRNEDWWITICSDSGYAPEIMGHLFEIMYHSKAPWRTYPSWFIEPLEMMYQEVRRTKDRDERFRIYRKANEYVADHALQLFTVAPLTLYGVNEQLNFVPQVSQYLYLDYSSVTDNHWSLQGRNN
jgi:peptide/nickel transport system substrate-binding protein